MKYISLIFVLSLLAACATTTSYTKFSESMLPDGLTWEVKSRVDCEDHRNNIEKCKSKLRDSIVKYGTELCGRPHERVFACEERGNTDYTVSGKCYVKCSK